MISDSTAHSNPYRDAWAAFLELSSRPPRPASTEPGGLVEQLAAIHLAAEMASRRGCSIADTWPNARRAMIAHVEEVTQ